MGGSRPAKAFIDEENRIAFFRSKVTQLNQAVDWYLFEVRPLIYPRNSVPKNICEELGFNCPDVQLMQEASTNFIPVSEGRAMSVSLSAVERSFNIPMKLISTGSIFDPDTEDELQQESERFVMDSVRLAKAAKQGNVDEARDLYANTITDINAFFQKVNALTEVPPGSEGYLQPLPTNEQFYTVLDNDRYWQRRKEKYIVKKKVDGTSKASKTVRFYAKSIYGEDAVSWDPRGDSGGF